MRTEMLPLYRLFQLVSPSLPTGGFTYSQGLEWAVECGWVHDHLSLVEWLKSVLYSGFAELEIPLMQRLYEAGESDDVQSFVYWSRYARASRETAELRQEEVNRGRAIARILGELGMCKDDDWLAAVKESQVAGYALAAVQWEVPLRQAALGYAWSWLENMVMAAVKLVPLGQTNGQQVLCGLDTFCVEIVEAGLGKEDGQIAGSCPFLTLGSCLHETQYTRLFRS